MTDDDGRAIIDDEGRLFGVVNIIDVLVVLLVVAVVVAGAALVFGGDPEPDPDVGSAYVTLDLGTQSEAIVEEFNEGDSYSPNNLDSLTITDVYVTSQGGNPQVLVRAELEGELSGSSVEYDGAPPRLGRSLDIVTDRYGVDGQVQAIGSDDSIARDSPTVVLTDRLTSDEVRSLGQGDELSVVDRNVGTLEDFAVYATDRPNEYQVYAEVELAANRQQGSLRFGDTPLRTGQTISLPGDGYTIDGTVEQVGSGLQRGEEQVLLVDTVDVEDAERIAEGDIAAVAGHTAATIERVQTYDTSDPDQKRVFLGASLETVEHGERPQFGETNVQRGNDISLRTDAYGITGRIQRVGALEERGTPATRTMTFRLDEVREGLAESIEPGQTERSDGQTLVDVTDVERTPSTILIQGQDGDLGVFDHPTDRDVTITAEVQVRETTRGVRFKGESIRQGDRVTLDLGVTTIDPTVERIE